MPVGSRRVNQHPSSRRGAAVLPLQTRTSRRAELGHPAGSHCGARAVKKEERGCAGRNSAMRKSSRVQLQRPSPSESGANDQKLRVGKLLGPSEQVEEQAEGRQPLPSERSAQRVQRDVAALAHVAEVLPQPECLPLPGLGHEPRRVWFTRPLPEVEVSASGGAPGVEGGGRRRERERGVPLRARGPPASTRAGRRRRAAPGGTAPGARLP